MFGIWCRVSGGVTGTREAWLKADGKVQLFDTREQAEEEAARLNKLNNGNPYRTADFRYTAQEYDA